MQTLPIKLTAACLPSGFKSITPQDLINAVAKYMSASVSDDVSFFHQGAVLPTSDVGPFFNTASGTWYQWSLTYGRYICDLGNFRVGDTVNTFVAGDDLSYGWVILDGRAINSVAGLTTKQKNALESFFGAGANLPSGLAASITGTIAAPANSTYTVLLSSPNALTINSLSIGLASGTCTAALQADGSTVSGMGAIAVTSTPQTINATAGNTLAVGKDITLVISAGASPVNLNYTVATTKTGAPYTKIYVGAP